MRRAEIADRLQQAIALAQAGQHSDARRLLEEVVAADPQQALAWMWLATVARDRDERVRCLARALALEPDNRAAQDAYQQLTGQVYMPPPSSPSRTGWRRVLLGDAPLGLGSYLLLLLVGAAAVVVIALVASGRDDEKQADIPPTPRFGLPSATAAPHVSPTPSVTPWPTRTPGPSPTLLWDAPPPTWTPVPTDTPAPSRTPAPSATSTPTAGLTPTPVPPSATFTPLPPTSTRTPSLTAQPATATSSATHTPARTATRTATRTAMPSPTGMDTGTAPPEEGEGSGRDES